MIGKLKGIVDSIGEGSAIIDVQGAVFIAQLAECEDGTPPAVTLGDEDILVGRLGSYVLIVQGNVTVVAMVSRSDVAARCWATPLSMVFIDGGHTMEAALSDYTCWSPHIMPGGYLLIHDIFADPSEGGQAPRRIFDLALSSGQFNCVSKVRTLGVLQRKK